MSVKWVSLHSLGKKKDRCTYTDDERDGDEEERVGEKGVDREHADDADVVPAAVPTDTVSTLACTS